MFMHASQSGNDVLTAGDHALPEANGTTNWLYGDSFNAMEGVIFGHGRLISGSGNDAMWGDTAFYANMDISISTLNPTLITTGHDTFVFYTNNGQDILHDFRQGEDVIKSQGIGGTTNFEALTTEVNGSDIVIRLRSNTITVVVCQL